MSDDDLIIGAEAMQCLERDRWGLVSMEHADVGVRNAQYVDSALRVVKDPLYLLLATFRRIPSTELLPWEVLRDVVEALPDRKGYEINRNRYFSLYGQDVEYERFQTYRLGVSHEKQKT